MKRYIKKSIIALIGAMMITTAAFAISADDAQNIVSQNYPDAMIMDVSEDTVDGVTVYKVFFHSQKVAPSDVTINADTGEIISRNVSYR